MALAHVREQRFGDRLSRGFSDPQHRRHGLRNQTRVRSGGELDQPYAVRVFVDDAGRDLQRKTRLAEAAGSDDGHQARARDQLRELDRLVGAPDERRHLLRQVVRRRLERSQRRERLAQRRVHDLIDALGVGEIAQSHEPEIAQRNVVRKAVADQVDGGLRHEDLSAVGRGHDPRGAVDRVAEEVAVAPFDDPRVESAADRERYAGRRGGVGQRLLEAQRRAHGVERIVERCVDAVARRLDDQSPHAFDGFARQRIVTGERGLHAVGLAFPQPRAAFDVRKQERRDGSGLLHDGIPSVGERRKRTLRDRPRHDQRRMIRTATSRP